MGTTTAKARSDVTTGDPRSETAAHIPGPWIYRPGKLNVENELGEGSITTDEQVPWYIAKIEDAPHAEANARLIAAAPEMLAALLEVMADTENLDPRFCADLAGETQDLIRAAITKATGSDRGSPVVTPPQAAAGVVP